MSFNWYSFLDDDRVPLILFLLVFLVALDGARREDYTSMAGALASILVLIFIGAQTKATREMVKEMKEERIEWAINEIVGYFDKFEEVLRVHLKILDEYEGDIADSKIPYLPWYSTRIPMRTIHLPDSMFWEIEEDIKKYEEGRIGINELNDRGAIVRVGEVIEHILSECGINTDMLVEYNEIVFVIRNHSRINDFPINYERFEELLKDLLDKYEKCIAKKIKSRNLRQYLINEM